MLKINRDNLKASHQLSWFVIDMLMLVLLIINLGLIIWDSIYGFVGIQSLLEEHAPAIHELYHPIHERFIFYDLAFVAIFLSEFILRWAYSVKARAYARWYFYPFIHWYDLVGCIPVGSLRFLRILRVVSIIHRLHQYQIIDFTDTRIYRFVIFYYEAFMEELSDRIVLKVLSGIQDEVRRGSPLFERIQHDIVLPRREMLADWLSDRVAQAAREGYFPHRGALRSYLEKQVNRALAQNPELTRLKYLPVVGPTIQEALESAVGDMVANVVHQVLEDLASSSNHAFIDDLVPVFLPDTTGPRARDQESEAIINLILEVIDAVKDQVRVKHWRENLP
ncbi:MAG TPA: hypothetical protein VKY53_05085 [Marinobacter sp.]|nr:hypothetical protein [Marinobacter sp.]